MAGGAEKCGATAGAKGAGRSGDHFRNWVGGPAGQSTQKLLQTWWFIWNSQEIIFISQKMTIFTPIPPTYFFLSMHLHKYKELSKWPRKWLNSANLSRNCHPAIIQAV